MENRRDMISQTEEKIQELEALAMKLAQQVRQISIAKNLLEKGEITIDDLPDSFGNYRMVKKEKEVCQGYTKTEYKKGPRTFTLIKNEAA